MEIYLETMMLPEGVADVIYNRALRMVADRVLPPVPEPKEAPGDELLRDDDFPSQPES